MTLRHTSTKHKVHARILRAPLCPPGLDERHVVLPPSTSHITPEYPPETGIQHAEFCLSQTG